MDEGVSFDNVALDYDFVSELFNNNDYFLSNLPNKKSRALDVGCGSGILTYAMSNYFKSVYGIDISQSMLDIGKMISLLAEDGKIVIIDNVSEVPTPKRILNIAGAYLDFFPNVYKYGVKNACRIYKHSTSKAWLDHLASDVYLSESESKELYSKYLPECTIERLGCFIAVAWHKRGN